MSMPYVEIKQGALNGKTVENIKGGVYYSFQGIPYAKPPVGELRFKAPQRPEPWQGVLDASREGNVCYQKDMLTKEEHGSEDCLFLNVYTNKLPGNEEVCKPVMVWIHGGGFILGSGNTDLYGPDFLLQEDVVLVTLNYRLGLLGFLSLEDSSLGVSGNAGLKDMVMALKWVKENINAFGGDPNNVTIFGESSGGWAVHLLVLSPLGKDLFHRAIVQSGCAFNPRSWGTRGMKHITEALNLEIQTEEEFLKYLNNLTTKEIFQMQTKLKDDFRADQRRPIGPVIENYENPSAFIQEDPITIISSGKFNHVPLIFGYTSREGMLMISSYTARGLEIPLTKEFRHFVSYRLNIPKGSEQARNVEQKIKKFYYGDEEPSLNNIDYTLQLYTDVFFLRGIYMAAKMHATMSTFPVYFYRFSVDAGLNWYKKLTKIKEAGACHCDELSYLFRSVVVDCNPPANSVEAVTIRRMTKLWATFALHGDPNPQQKCEEIGLLWPPIQNKKVTFLDIGENLTIGDNPEFYRMAFWDTLSQTY